MKTFLLLPTGSFECKGPPIRDPVRGTGQKKKSLFLILHFVVMVSSSSRTGPLGGKGTHRIAAPASACRHSDSNRDALALVPKTNVSTNFTMAATCVQVYHNSDPGVNSLLLLLKGPPADALLPKDPSGAYGTRKGQRGPVREKEEEEGRGAKGGELA